MTFFPGLSDSNLPHHWDMASSLNNSSPTILMDFDSGIQFWGKDRTPLIRTHWNKYSNPGCAWINEDTLINRKPFAVPKLIKWLCTFQSSKSRYFNDKTEFCYSNGSYMPFFVRRNTTTFCWTGLSFRSKFQAITHLCNLNSCLQCGQHDPIICYNVT